MLGGGEGVELLRVQPRKEILRKLQPQLSQKGAREGVQSRQPGELLISM